MLLHFLVVLLALVDARSRRRWWWSAPKPKRSTLGNYTPKKYLDTNRKLGYMKFYYFNKNNKWASGGSTKMSVFRAGKPTKVVTHGFTDSKAICKGFVEGWIETKKMDVNVICVDWSSLAALSNSIFHLFNIYEKAATHSQFAGIRIAEELIKVYRQSGGGNGKQFFGTMHLLGHSLGAQAMGRAGRTIKKNTGFTVDRITGLDPAGPGFMNTKDGYGAGRGKLRTTDASFVDVIHSNGALSKPAAPRGYFGHLRPLGHVDFFPAGGSWQPGCNSGVWLKTGQCSHGRSVQYFVESITKPQEWTAYKCSVTSSKHSCYATSEKAFGSRKTTAVHMGDAAGNNRKLRGTYWMNANSKALFGQNQGRRRRSRRRRRSME